MFGLLNVRDKQQQQQIQINGVKKDLIDNATFLDNEYWLLNSRNNVIVAIQFILANELLCVYLKLYLLFGLACS